MRQLLPSPSDEVDLDAAYDPGATDRRPWVVALFVASADGAAWLGGRSGGLGGPGDRAVFRAVRARADVVVVGAGTVRTEGYGPLRVGPDQAAARVARGQEPHPRLLVVSGSLALDPAQRLFAEADGTTAPPLVAHLPGADAQARHRLGRVAELVELPPSPAGGIPARAVVAELARRGAGVAVLEGGPTLAGGFVDADLVDEVSLTLDPRLVGGAAPRLVVGTGGGADRAWRSVHLLEEDGVLFWRLRRDRG